MRLRLLLLVLLCALAGSCLPKGRPKLPPLCGPLTPPHWIPECRKLAETK